MVAFSLTLLFWTSLRVDAAETFEGYTFYVGDPHAHTGVSTDGFSSDLRDGGPEGTGALTEVFEIAQGNGLDWVALTDHVNDHGVAVDEVWNRSFAMALDHDDETTGLVVIPAAELALNTADGSLGHRNLYFFGSDEHLADLDIDDTRPLGDPDFIVEDCGVFWAWVAELDATFGPLLMIPHHPYGVFPAPVDYTCHSESYEKAVEIYSSHGTGLGDWTGYDLPSSGTVATGAAHHAMDPDGLAISFGFMGGTDNHYTCPGDLCSKISWRGRHVSTGGLTMLAIPEGDPWGRRAVYQALVDHRSAAISGPAVPFVVEYSSEGALLGGLGQTVELDADSALDVEIRIPAAWVPSVQGVYLTFMDEHWELDSIADGVWTTRFDADSIPAWVYPSLWIDGELAAGSSYCDDGNDTTDEWVWGSPSWLNVTNHDADHDGYRDDSGDCDDLDASVHPGASELCDGVDNDCDGVVDGPEAQGAPMWYPDSDNDGYPADTGGVSDCQQPKGYLAEEGAWDCDDDDSSVYPGATEIEGDSVDQDCDGEDLAPGDTDSKGKGSDPSCGGCATSNVVSRYGTLVLLFALVFARRRGILS